MNISNLKTYYKSNFNSQLKSQLKRYIHKNPWFEYYLDYVSYDDEIGWIYSGETFDNIPQMITYIDRHEKITK